MIDMIRAIWRNLTISSEQKDVEIRVTGERADRLREIGARVNETDPTEVARSAFAVYDFATAQVQAGRRVVVVDEAGRLTDIALTK